MKITIDETNKIIEIEEDVNLNDFFQFLKERNINTEEYIIKAVKIRDYYNPYIPYYPAVPYIPPYSPAPYWNPDIPYGPTTTSTC